MPKHITPTKFTTAYKVVTHDNKSLFADKGWLRIYKLDKWVFMRRPAFVFKTLNAAIAFKLYVGNSSANVYKCSVTNLQIQRTMGKLNHWNAVAQSKYFSNFWKCNSNIANYSVRPGTYICDAVRLDKLIK